LKRHELSTRWHPPSPTSFRRYHEETMTHATRELETVLVVDDDAELRRLIVRVLRVQGYDVLEAGDGEEALVVAGQHAAPIHLIVSDVNMPNMGGWILLDHLRGWYPSIRFLMVSGFPVSAEVADGRADTRTGFLAKPFTPPALSSAVRDLLDQPGR
jgi:two-component system cell cycle sensor histidine kinase/response regulator CckA